ncbi:hypothetical protein B6R96_13000 [Streptomyces sp. Sge12]|nr:hypothetical protein B6R96_13000 [Streptomyces sp. Sge12]
MPLRRGEGHPGRLTDAFRLDGRPPAPHGAGGRPFFPSCVREPTPGSGRRPGPRKPVAAPGAGDGE